MTSTSCHDGGIKRGASERSSYQQYFQYRKWWLQRKSLLSGRGSSCARLLDDWIRMWLYLNSKSSAILDDWLQWMWLYLYSNNSAILDDWLQRMWLYLNSNSSAITREWGNCVQCFSECWAVVDYSQNGVGFKRGDDLIPCDRQCW